MRDKIKTIVPLTFIIPCLIACLPPSYIIPKIDNKTSRFTGRAGNVVVLKSVSIPKDTIPTRAVVSNAFSKLQNFPFFNSVESDLKVAETLTKQGKKKAIYRKKTGLFYVERLNNLDLKNYGNFIYIIGGLTKYQNKTVFILTLVKSPQADTIYQSIDPIPKVGANNYHRPSLNHMLDYLEAQR